MRMWLVHPNLMCNKHLLGEHVEMHMFRGTILKGISIDGYIKNGLIDVSKIKIRHDEIVEEMIRRGMNHKTPMECFNEGQEVISVNSSKNVVELFKRCSECRERIRSNFVPGEYNVLCTTTHSKEILEIQEAISCVV